MHTSTRVIGVAAALVLTAFLSGCGGSSESGSDDATTAEETSSTAEGTWGGSGDGEPQLVLGPDGTLSGTDGCNRLVGSWEEDGSVVTFGEVASTMMACSGVDTWLSALDQATLGGDTLTVMSADGTEIGSLTRSEAP